MAIYEILNPIKIITPKFFSLLIFIGTLLLAQLACRSATAIPLATITLSPSLETPTPIPDLPTQSPSDTPEVATSTPEPEFIPTSSPTSTLTHTSTPSPPPTGTPSPTLTPTFAILRGQVIPERANCRYGPGWMYLYKYGLVGGSNLEIIGRMDLGDWVLLQAIGGNNPCWVRADLMDIKGDVLSVEPVDVHVILPWSPYYPPLTNVSAIRVDDTITVSWASVTLRAGDEADPVLYVVEAWVCRDGQLVFAPDGTFQTAVKILDEPGCDEPSHGRVMLAEKHGYSWPVEVPWP